MKARLTVRVQPGARQTGVAGIMADGTLKLEVREPAEGGRANRAVEKLLAELLQVTSADVSVVRGAGARGKVIEVRGLDQERLRARLAAVQETTRREREERDRRSARTRHGE